jgi:amidase
VWGDASWAPPHTEPYRFAIDRDPGKLKIGIWRDPLINGAVVEPEILAALDSVAEQLARLGHEIVENNVTIPVDGNVLAAMFVDLFTDMGSIQQRLLGAIGKGGAVEATDVEPLSWAIAEKAAGRSATDAWTTKVSLEALTRVTIAALSPYDVVLSPALATAPPEIGWITGALTPDPFEAFTRAERFMPFSPPANVTGLPAISLPTHQSSTGLPIGVQLVGRACEEHVLLQVGAQLERELRWDQRIAPLATSA